MKTIALIAHDKKKDEMLESSSTRRYCESANFLQHTLQARLSTRRLTCMSTA